LAALGLPTTAAHLPPAARQPDALLDHMSRDKKMKQGRLNLILARGIGRAFVTADVLPGEISDLLADFLNAEGDTL
jgi:3-dehydroquinate synthase